jgi:Rod binding domain-containing protein
VSNPIGSNLPLGVGDLNLRLHGDRQEQLKQVTEQFESIFIEMMFQQMRKGAAALGVEQPSFARQVFESWQDQQWALAMVRGGGIGLAAQLQRQLSDKTPGK